MFHQLKLIILNISIIVFAIFVITFSAGAAEDTKSENRRERCVKILYQGLNHDGYFWVSVHAAEALLWNGYFDGVNEKFAAMEDSTGARHRIGVWRVLAQANTMNPAEYHKYVDLISAAFVDHKSPDRIQAIETLGKLGFSKQLPEIVHASNEEKEEIKVYARWVLANDGDPENEDALSELLSSENSKLYGTAGYALRFFDNVQPRTFSLLEQCVTRLPFNAENRIYVASAMYVHASPEKKEQAKRELLKYAIGNKNERYEVCEALSYKGEKSDIEFLEILLDDPEVDVRVSAANAVIRIERRQLRGLRWLDWTVIGGFVLFMLGIGWYYSRRQKSAEDYFLGGRNIHPILSGLSLFATLLSTISYLAYPGEMIKHGPIAFLGYVPAVLVSYLLVGYFMIPLFMKLKITSAYEILEKPLGVNVRLWGSIMFLLTRIIWMALLLFLTAKAMVVMMSWNESLIPYIALTGGIITVIYSSMGGLKAVITTDVTQFVILLIGAVLTVVLITAKMGGVGAWFPTEWAPTWDKFVFFSADSNIRVTIVGTFVAGLLWWICTAGSDQMAIQRYLATRDVRTARKALLTSGLADIGVYMLFVLVGFALLNFFRTNPHLVADGKSIIEDADFLFPHYIANLLPIGITGLVIAGLLSAAMSSFSSGINSTATVIASDFFSRLKNRNNTATNNIKLARYISISVGIVAILISTFVGKVPGNIMEITAKTNGLFITPLFSLFFMALFIPFSTPLGTIFGSFYCLYAGFLVAFWDVVTGRPGLSFQWIYPVSLLVGLVFGILFSLLPTRGKSSQVQFFWSIILIIPPLVVTYFLID